jgi:hypothetical protein
LQLDTEASSPSSRQIQYNVGSKLLTDEFKDCLETPNLNKVFGLTSSIDAITIKIRDLLAEKCMQGDRHDGGEMGRYDRNNLRVTSVPMLFNPDLK